MQPFPAPAAPSSHGLARAFLALTDDPALPLARRSGCRALAAVAAVAVLVLSGPAGWLSPALLALEPGDHPAPVLGTSSKAALAHDDEDDDAPE